MKYTLLILFAMLLFVKSVHAEVLTTNYYPGWNDYQNVGIDAIELARNGFPQFGQGTFYVYPNIQPWQKDPNVIYDVYYPRMSEMIQWSQALSGKPVIIYGVDKGSSYMFRAVTNGITGKDGRYPIEAVNNLLLKQKNVPMYSTGAQLWTY